MRLWKFSSWLEFTKLALFFPFLWFYCSVIFWLNVLGHVIIISFKGAGAKVYRTWQENTTTSTQLVRGFQNENQCDPWPTWSIEPCDEIVQQKYNFRSRQSLEAPPPYIAWVSSGNHRPRRTLEETVYPLPLSCLNYRRPNVSVSLSAKVKTYQTLN